MVTFNKKARYEISFETKKSLSVDPLLTFLPVLTKLSDEQRFTVDQSLKEKRYPFNAKALLFIVCQC